MCFDLRSVVGGIHHIVETGDLLMGDLRQWDGRLAIVRGGGGKQAADGNAAIDGIDMECVSDPAH